MWWQLNKTASIVYTACVEPSVFFLKRGYNGCNDRSKQHYEKYFLLLFLIVWLIIKTTMRIWFSFERWTKLFSLWFASSMKYYFLLAYCAWLLEAVFCINRHELKIQWEQYLVCPAGKVALQILYQEPIKAILTKMLWHQTERAYILLENIFAFSCIAWYVPFVANSKFNAPNRKMSDDNNHFSNYS